VSDVAAVISIQELFIKLEVGGVFVLFQDILGAVESIMNTQLLIS